MRYFKILNIFLFRLQNQVENSEFTIHNPRFLTSFSKIIFINKLILQTLFSALLLFIGHQRIS